MDINTPNNGARLNMYQPPHASMSRVLNNEAKEAGYARQLKRGAKKVEEILQEIE